MILDGKSVEQLIRVLTNDRQLIERTSSLTGLTLGAVVELSAHLQNGLGTAFDPISTTERIFNAPILQKGRSVWEQRFRPDIFIETHSVRDLDFCSIFQPQHILDETWHVFESRFARTMKQVGFPAPFTDGFMGAMNEMADNIIQHSGKNETMPAQGMVAYVVDEFCSSFVLTDLGLGAQDSLKRNPDWQALSSDRDALSAIVEKNASRRTGQGPGNGYRDLFRALADRNCLVRLKSGDGLYELQADGNSRVSTTLLRPLRRGFSVEVVCFRTQEKKERIFRFDNFT